MPSSCSASQWGCHLKDIPLSFSPPLVLFRPLCSLHQLRVAVPMRAQPASVSVFPVHRSRHKMEIRHSKARWSDWTRSVCLKRRNPIYVCNEVYSLRTRTMCSNAEDRWPVGQVLGRTPKNRMSCAFIFVLRRLVIIYKCCMVIGDFYLNNNYLL